MSGVPLNAPIVGIADTFADPRYLLFGRDGGVFSFGGQAPFVGSFLGARCTHRQRLFRRRHWANSARASTHLLCRSK